MAKLTDLAPVARSVLVRGIQIDVPGISAAGLAGLVRRYRSDIEALQLDDQAALARLWNDKASLFEKILSGAPEFLAAVLAAGTGEPGDTNAEAAAARLPVEQQATLLLAIVEETMPGGFGPFVETIEKLVDMVDIPDAMAKAGLVGGAGTPSPKESISS